MIDSLAAHGLADPALEDLLRRIEALEFAVAIAGGLEAAHRVDPLLRRHRLFRRGYPVGIENEGPLERDDGGVVTQASVILGGVANTPYRARRAERAMIGHRLTDAAIDRISGAWAAQAHPLPNNGWKVEAACGVLKRVLAVLANE